MQSMHSNYMTWRGSIALHYVCCLMLRVGPYTPINGLVFICPSERSSPMGQLNGRDIEYRVVGGGFNHSRLGGKACIQCQV